MVRVIRNYILNTANSTVNNFNYPGSSKNNYRQNILRVVKYPEFSTKRRHRLLAKALKMQNKDILMYCKCENRCSLPPIKQSLTHKRHVVERVQFIYHRNTLK